MLASCSPLYTGRAPPYRSAPRRPPDGRPLGAAPRRGPPGSSTPASSFHHWRPQAVREIHPDLGHATNWDEAIAATSFVPDEVIAQLCDALGLIGTPEYCAQRIAG